MKLVDMQMDEAAAEEMAEPTKPGDQPRYPWGLSITLDQDALKKLGLKELPDVDSEFQIEARATVTNVSSSQEVDGDERRSVGLQITAIACAPASAKDTADTLYDKKGAE